MKLPGFSYFHMVGEKGVQLVTISRPTAYGEYAPYVIAENQEEFVRLVQTMC